MNKVLVTGATGNVGSKVVAELRARGVPGRAFVRDLDKGVAVLGDDTELAQGDFADRPSIRRALDGVEQVFLTSADGPWKVEQQKNVIDAAAAAGVRRVVELSAAGAEVGSPAAFWDWQGQIEQHLRASGIPAVIIQACFYMSNLLASAEAIRQTGKLFAPAGGARIAMIDPRDVAAAAAAVFADGGHDGQTYVLTGPEAITYDEIAGQLSAATGRKIEFVDVPEEAARQGTLQAGMPDWVADGLVTLFANFRRGAHPHEQPTDTVRALTGREPRSFAEFARDHAGLFRT